MDLAGYCEAMLYDYEPEWRPEGLVEIDRSDLLAWKQPGWPIGRNRVAYAKWTAAEADPRIDEVLAFFGSTPFRWHVGPSSTPDDLEQRLLRRGLVAAERPRMMTASLPLSRLREAAVRIVEVVDRATARTGLALAHHAGANLERDLEERMAYLSLPTRRSGWLVALAGDEPVANAGYRFSSDRRCLYLTGAETIESHRGRGIYQSLVAYRAELAHARGCEIVSILANRHTSAPILARHGFRDHGDLPHLEPPEVQRFARHAVPDPR